MKFNQSFTYNLDCNISYAQILNLPPSTQYKFVLILARSYGSKHGAGGPDGLITMHLLYGLQDHVRTLLEV
jgi:hypothetical protein